MKEPSFPLSVPCVLIAGPTASGKSSAAMAVAEKLNGVIVNADSMQVYKDLRVLTARPSVEDEQAVPHCLYGYLDASERCSAARWAMDARGEIATIHEHGKRPVIVGGTGLYFRVLEEGLSPIPDVPDEIRERAEHVLKSEGLARIRQEVTTADPDIAERLADGDRQRWQRAWEVLKATGKPLTYWQAQPRQPVLANITHKYVLMPDRERLYANCNKRLELMMEAGALEEAKALIARNLPENLPAMNALGVPELAEHLAGSTSLEDAIALTATRTRQFAKRQMTWFRQQNRHWTHVSSTGDLIRAVS